MLSILMTVALGGCGGTGFGGRYVGEIQRTDTRNNTSNTKSENWTIDERGATLTRDRDGVTCQLTLETGDCSEGCFNKVIVDGECTFDGERFTLETGLIESGNVSDNDFQISTSWTSTTGVQGAIVESGVITKQ